MKLNLKLTVVASLLLISPITFAQTATTTSIADTVTITNIAPKADDSVKKPVKKVKIVRKKSIATKVEVAPTEIEMISENNIVEEKVATVESYDYSNVNVVPQFVLVEEKNKWGFKAMIPKLMLNALDRQGNPYPLQNFVYNNGHNLTLIQMNTDLSSTYERELSTNNTFESLIAKDTCQAFFVKYKLKGNSDFKINKFFLNSEGTIENSLPSTCKITTKDERDSTEYSAKGYISDISFTKAVSDHTQNLEFILHLVKNGKDYFGQELKAYVVTDNFENIYLPVIIPHRKGPYFGTTLITNPPKSGRYNVVVPFYIDEGKQIVRVTRTVY